MKNKNILIVAAHTDDEALGCGGTILKHTERGDKVFCIFMTDGISSRNCISDYNIKQRLKSAQKAHKILGLNDVKYLNFPDNCMDSIPLLKIVKEIEGLIKLIKPEIIYTHHHGDLNIDHQITNQAVLTACRPVPGNTVRELLTFEILSSTEWNTAYQNQFVPNVFVDITKNLGKKIESLKEYKLEMRDYPHTRSIENIEYLARHRGATVGVEAAEAFMLVRLIK